jgi:hypothetical protein
VPYVHPDLVLQAKQLDLLTYLRTREPDELVHIAGGEYSTKTHDSLKISNGLWAWNSQGIGGKSALDYLIKVRGMGFSDAVNHLLGQAAMPSVSFCPAKAPPKKTLILPPPAPNNDRVIAYLTGRGIARDVLDVCVKTGRLYESANYHNCVFVGFDKAEKPRYAALRATNSGFKGEVGGSDKQFAFSLPAENAQKLHVFESVIDLLSFVTLCPEAQQDHLLSLAGVFAPAKRSSGRLPTRARQGCE